MTPITRCFRGRRPAVDPTRIPPGRHHGRGSGEQNGHHRLGDPWRAQRSWSD